MSQVPLQVEAAVSVVITSVMSVLKHEFGFTKHQEKEFEERLMQNIAESKAQLRERIRAVGGGVVTDLKDYGTRYL